MYRYFILESPRTVRQAYEGFHISNTDAFVHFMIRLVFKCLHFRAANDTELNAVLVESVDQLCSGESCSRSEDTAPFWKVRGIIQESHSSLNHGYGSSHVASLWSLHLSTDSDIWFVLFSTNAMAVSLTKECHCE